ncbi:hypothetical protein HPB50_021264 [Hyalomma asiaticum]|uniref:Uncharacterized protein n=1 Tax=Hyalomma asiaticum TaxID=266040 RepID=A0ACB7TKS9_HYAAI|nr:hypothetical protein HPB50_021264 [Hyalomma asiaticum]
MTISRRYDERYVLGTRSSGRTMVHVWGAISHTGLGPLHRFPGRLTSETYMDVFETVLIPHVLDGPFPDGLYYLQQDYAPIHISKAVQKMLDDLGVVRLNWPARSTDLNRDIWGPMKPNLAKDVGLAAATADEL